MVTGLQGSAVLIFSLYLSEVKLLSNILGDVLQILLIKKYVHTETYFIMCKTASYFYAMV